MSNEKPNPEKRDETLADDIEKPVVCAHCGGSRIIEGGFPCHWCQPWIPRKFA